MSTKQVLGMSLSQPALPDGDLERMGRNVSTSFNPWISDPVIAKTARVHPLAAVIGSVTLGERVFVAPAASVRGD